MTIIDQKGWQPLAQHLTDLLCGGMSLGDAVAIVAERPDSRVIHLVQAVQRAGNVSSREAAKIVAHGITGKSL